MATFEDFYSIFFWRACIQYNNLYNQDHKVATTKVVVVAAAVG